MDFKPQSSTADISRTGEWNPEIDDTLVCVDVHQETHDVKTFTFAAPDGKQFAFLAGQYLLFDLALGGDAESRCYSISSSPYRKNAVSITVKRVPGGKVSNWLHDNLTAGAAVRANGPLGRFVRPSSPRGKFLFLSGGSGITPVMSMIRELADTSEPADVVFMHAGRTPKDLVFREELTNLANRMKGLRLHFLPEEVSGERCWPGLSGRISREYLSLAVPDLAERLVMCCGPAPFMAAARRLTAELGVPSSNYIEESFDAAVLEEEAPPVSELAEAKTFKVEFVKQTRTIEVAAEQTVLSCAKKSGVRIPSSCANGLCGTCKSKLVSGSVDMNHSGGIRQREIDAGFFLPCCSKPLSDLVIDR
ncbi:MULTISPECIES: hybrid-cluster NAD(P)-dependent oxidoreductase [unclassified Sinorhizobium]|uniref:hybrid-cluster NAD(P)-dependent oxidoreductase n=1 Tax=unclassified Sinorhizobium TaxID=2613772 RepID=UPI0024C294E3|nr:MULTISPECIES: hybrid-cluster NAD(P)-dependent oxidoreductase [unclassified Sinorhizobium]MDK1378702.1 hybrid-cluster NAD(P)-dependent oxidoreductase [Sinorhizobium sp. 6-70]MDK1481381.1 hybrid-cluster NAD(P)-dependent oxidoreductase [Sinorhizobium sp. 6-117]